MIIKEVNLETVCGYTSKLPDNQKPEIAFAGKSNVGKSSQCVDEQKVVSKDICTTGKDTDY